MLHQFTFLTLPSYSLIALANAIEVLRMANRVLRGDFYQWRVVSMDGVATASSAGVAMEPTFAWDLYNPGDVVLVCGGVHVKSAITPFLLSALRAADKKNVALGSLCTGGYVLACAGLLDDHRAAIHWENQSALREVFPRVHTIDKLFVIDRNRYTCSGGVAPLDMFLNIVTRQNGKHIARQVSEQFTLDRIRGDNDQQYIPLGSRIGLYHSKLVEAATLMEANIEEPLPLDELARLVGISRRQIERLFKRYIGQVPAKYYLEMRLNRARQLLLQTSMTVLEVAVACGFQSPPHFSKCYRQTFGHSPSEARRLND